MSRPPNIPKRKLPSPAKCALQQNKVETLIQHALAMHQQKSLKEAQVLYEQALAIQPNHFDALQLLGTLSAQTKQSTKAVDFLTKALQINPNYAEAYSIRGVALQELKRLDEAIASYDQAISINPNHADAYHNRGVALKELKRLNEAIASYDQAISINPNHAEAYSNRGIALIALNRLDEALASYDQAISIKPDYAEPYWNKSLALLLDGQFAQGWQEHEWRWKNEMLSTYKEKRYFLQPLWLGAETLKDKTILLYAEQGFGDTIQFCRYVPLVTQLGAKVILEVQRPLVKLLNNLEGVSSIIAKGDTLPAFDYQCPLLSLPLAFKTELNTIPPVLKNITSDNEKNSKWQINLAEKLKPRVGLVWSGSTGHGNDHNRSLTLSQLLPYLPSNMDYVCLQKELRDIDKALLAQHPEIQYFGDALEDFTDTAALCELMDVVISVDTSVAHLAGTLGKKTWVLLPYHPDWRWLLDRDDSPWYQSAKLYRQERIGDWDGMLEKIRVDLLEYL